jgi:hypothetical protein
MNHGMGDLDTGAEAISEDTPGLFLQERQESTGRRKVARADMNCDCELPFQMLDNAGEFGLIPASHEQ